MVGVKMHQCNNCIFLTEIRAPALSFGVPIARASIAALPGPRLPFCLTQGAPSGPNDFIDLHLEQMQSRKGYISSIFLFAARDFFLPACCGLNFDPTNLPNSSFEPLYPKLFGATPEVDLVSTVWPPDLPKVR